MRVRCIYSDMVFHLVELTDDRVNEVKRRAEDAVTDVKRKAVVELQKAVSAAEEKANDALSQAHQRMDKAVLEARRQATEETSIIINQQENSKEVQKYLLFLDVRICTSVASKFKKAFTSNTP